MRVDLTFILCKHDRDALVSCRREVSAEDELGEMRKSKVARTSGGYCR